jgi:TctA family transporter
VACSRSQGQSPGLRPQLHNSQHGALLSPQLSSPSMPFFARDFLELMVLDFVSVLSVLRESLHVCLMSPACQLHETHR